MGQRGRAPQPARLRVLKGNGKDRTADHTKVKPQPQAVPAIPPMPAELGAAGERIWLHVTPELARMGILGSVDLGALEMYCRLYQAIYEHGGGRGFAMLVTSFVNIGSKLGLDPMSRMRMTLPEARDDEEDRIFGTG